MINVLKLAFIFNLVFSYCIHIKPCNTIFEYWVLGEENAVPQWAKRLSRFILCVLGACIAVLVAEKLDKFLGLMGAVLCAPVAFMIPAWVHLSTTTDSCERVIDMLLILMSVAVAIFCATQCIITW